MPIIVWCDLLKCRRMNPPEIDEISILAIPQPAQALQVLCSQCCGTIPGGARHLRIRLCFPISNSITTICLWVTCIIMSLYDKPLQDLRRQNGCQKPLERISSLEMLPTFQRSRFRHSPLFSELPRKGIHWWFKSDCVWLRKVYESIANVPSKVCKGSTRELFQYIPAYPTEIGFQYDCVSSNRNLPFWFRRLRRTPCRLLLREWVAKCGVWGLEVCFLGPSRLQPFAKRRF